MKQPTLRIFKISAHANLAHLVAAQTSRATKATKRAKSPSPRGQVNGSADNMDLEKIKRGTG